MRFAMAQPCFGSSEIVLRIKRSSVPWTRSFVFAILWLSTTPIVNCRGVRGELDGLCGAGAPQDSCYFGAPQYAVAFEPPQWYACVRKCTEVADGSGEGGDSGVSGKTGQLSSGV